MSAHRIYRGEVTHARVRPRAHRLRYRIFQVLLDLDEGAPARGRLRLFGWERPALLGFRATDHLSGDGDLKGEVARLLSLAGARLEGPVRLLCMPRVAGQVFNPLSLFFCHRAGGEVAAVICEVNNTFGERHAYVLPVEQRPDGRMSQTCAKQFFVSPFMAMGLTYRFDIACNAEAIAIRIRVDDAEGPVLWAAFRGHGQPFTDRNLFRAWISAPLLSLKVLGAIHWEALWIWLKGVRLQPRTPRRGLGVTVAARFGAAA